jgi:two-component system, OmpR family, response regulator
MTATQHIYVVDDEAPAREMVGDYLKLHGFDVTLCDGGGSLRAAIARQSPDLIILDLNMPEEDGLSIVRALKQHGSVPIIMLTATASPIDRVVGLELGADDYLAKPCELRELLARVRSVLRLPPPPGRRPTGVRRSASAPSGSMSTRRYCATRKATSIRWSLPNSRC